MTFDNGYTLDGGQEPAPHKADRRYHEGQPPWRARRHGSTAFRKSQPKVRLAIASESARLSSWPPT